MTKKYMMRYTTHVCLTFMYVCLGTYIIVRGTVQVAFPSFATTMTHCFSDYAMERLIARAIIADRIVFVCV